jgi:NAD(P)H-dependent flavin oxidoreductase YrpB (nitropropane dioxygenase family)
VDLWSRLADVQSRWNVLDHPFYQRWSRGELSADELAVYAGQYRHAVVALAQAAGAAARAAGDADGFHLWAGQAYGLAAEVPAGELVGRLAAEAREALASAGGALAHRAERGGEDS